MAFIAAVFICFIMYFGFEGIANADMFGDFNPTIEKIGMKRHFDSIARGVIDTRDVIYFVSVTIFFLFLTVLQLKKR